MASAKQLAAVVKYAFLAVIARRSSNPQVFAHRVRHLGDACRRLRRPALAERCYLQALAIYRRRSDTRPLDLANAARGYAVLKQQVGALQDARALWQEAHDLYAALDVAAGVAESTAQLALLDARH